MLALINTLYVYVWDGETECLHSLIRHVWDGETECLHSIIRHVWDVESECLRFLKLRVCEGMGDLLLAPNNTICMLRKGTGTH